LIAAPVFADFTYYQDFESLPIDEEYPDGSTGCSVAGLYDNHLGVKENCGRTVRDDFTARYGDQYVEFWCNFDDSTEAEFVQSQRAAVHFRHSDLTSCNRLAVDNGTEYWWGWSNYIPSDYYVEYRSHIVAGISSGTMILTVTYGGDEAHNKERFRLRVWRDGDYDFIYLPYHWEDFKGTWVDWVVQYRGYTSSNADATLVLYLNGEAVYNWSDGQNCPVGESPVIAFYEYNTYNYAAYYATRDSFVRAADLDDAPTPWRRVPLDEVRVYEATKGVNDYCDVCPPIVPAAPTVTYPKDKATGIPVTFTATFSGYSDSRPDPQSCFAYRKTEIEIDESGGNWSSLVLHSEVEGQTFYNVPGLEGGKTYQMRVRHKAARRGSSDTYWGEWSDTIKFTNTSSPGEERNLPMLNAPENLRFFKRP
jgi:hypothetical protein